MRNGISGTDAFTKMARVSAIGDKSAPTVAQAILEIMYTFGVPRQIHSDQGLEFCNQLMKVICDKLNINRTATTPYHPQCNAAAERFNRTMGQYLRKAIHDSESSSLDWELYLGPLMLSYNSGVSKSTRMSPFYATFGFDSRLPLWVGAENDHINSEPLANDKHADMLARLHHAQRVARNIAHNNLQQARENNLEQLPPRKIAFTEGDRVWVKVNVKPVPNPKLAPDGEAGIIIERLSDSTYKVLRPDRRRKKTVTLNVTQLRPRHSRHPADPEENQQEEQEEQEDREDKAPEECNDDSSRTRRSARLAHKASHSYTEESDDEEDAEGVSDDDVAVLLDLVNAVKATKEIEHLLPAKARRLPFYEAINFIRFDTLDIEDFRLLLSF